MLDRYQCFEEPGATFFRVGVTRTLDENIRLLQRVCVDLINYPASYSTTPYKILTLPDVRNSCLSVPGDITEWN